MNLRALLDNPAVLIGLLRSALILATTFGVGITSEQQNGLIETAGAFLAVVSLALTGVTATVTTPKATPTLVEGTEVKVITPEGEPDRVAVV